MKKTIITILVTIALASCKEDKKITDIPEQKVIRHQVDTLTDDGIEVGKTVFSREGNTVIIFDANSQSGKISIDGKEYPLNQMVFYENNYELQGKNISIEAYEGDFTTDKNDCIEGHFHSVSVKFDQQELILDNIKVHDCPQY